MTDQVYVAAASSLVSLFGIIGIAVLFRSYQLDSFREQIFALREEVFLYALDQGLLESPAYREFRALLNGTLRYAHKVTFPHMLMLILVKRVFKLRIDKENNPMRAWETAVDRLSPEQKAQFHRFNKIAIELFVKRIAFSSMLFWGFALYVVLRAGVNLRFVAISQPKAALAKLFGAVQGYLPINMLEAEALKANYAFSGAA